MIRRGDILLLSFPFTDLQTTKVRPAVVVSSDPFNKTSADAIFIFITSKEYTTPFSLRIKRTDPGFKTTGLKLSSTFRISKLMCLEQKLARRRLGYANKNMMEKIDSVLKRLFDLT
jgi:mRNA interferase MazF